MVSLTQDDGTVISVAQGSWASVENPSDPTKDRFVELGGLPAHQRKAMTEWLSKLGALAASVPFGLAVILEVEPCGCTQWICSFGSCIFKGS